VAGVERARVEGGDKPEDIVRKIHRLKQSVAKAQSLITREGGRGGAPGGIDRLSDLSSQMKGWEEFLEEIRADLADLIAERDRWQIAHDKLRERLDHHSIEPRSQVERKRDSARAQGPRREPAAPGESQDFSAIDRELELLNASMLRAFSSE
jgi:hypothetical protein